LPFSFSSKWRRSFYKRGMNSESMSLPPTPQTERHLPQSQRAFVHTSCGSACKFTGPSSLSEIAWYSE
jgi:hypothetical protein